ncbi:uncharacterized protein LOC123311756 [Coccinella septempunctata]|uniref:uncharacterized protein LOC123311756 n=1 Tax=Coccinella septempunctata TaxID=41139 RepID=UPI001D08B661|nr:uncharacterized protein LOC123311756 [Coccinella septempunctata]
MDFQDQLKLNVFNGPTTYLNDYRKYPGIYRINPDYSRAKFEKPRSKPPPSRLIDQETFVPLRKKIPMNLMIQPNEVTGTNPHKEIGDTVLPEDEKKEEVIKTRPRVQCAPQVSLDDISDPEMKKLLLDYAYTTDFRKAEQELLSMLNIEYREVPNTVVEHDRFLEKTRKHYFSVYFKPKPLLLIEMTPELNKKGMKWTNEQLVGAANINELFWQNHDVKCGACYQPLMTLVEKETKKKIGELVEKDWLRMPHDKQCPGYAGFTPDMAIGMSLAKTDLPCAHPLLSTSQVVARRKLKDSDIPKFS